MGINARHSTHRAEAIVGYDQPSQLLLQKARLRNRARPAPLESGRLLFRRALRSASFLSGVGGVTQRSRTERRTKIRGLGRGTVGEPAGEFSPVSATTILRLSSRFRRACPEKRSAVLHLNSPRFC